MHFGLWYHNLIFVNFNSNFYIDKYNHVENVDSLNWTCYLWFGLIWFFYPFLNTHHCFNIFPSNGRALHDKEERPKNGVTRNQFFLIAFICSFGYYVFPGYLFPMLSSVSWLCLLFPSSVLVQQLGSGLHGLGVGTIGFDWSTISSYLGSPLASPWFATANIAVGYFLIMYVVTPLMYWFNVYKARNFPIFSDGLFKEKRSWLQHFKHHRP